MLISGAKLVKALISKEMRGRAFRMLKCTLSLLKELHPLPFLPIGIRFYTAFKTEVTADILSLPVFQTQAMFSNIELVTS